MFKGAFVFALGGASGLVVGFALGVLLTYKVQEIQEADMISEPTEDVQA